MVVSRCSAEIHRMQLQRNAVLRDQWQQSLCSLTNAAINRREIDIIAYNSSINICTWTKMYIIFFFLFVFASQRLGQRLEVAKHA